MAALRAADLDVTTLADIWGEEAAQRVPDDEWIRYAGERAMIALTADDAIRYYPPNKEALLGSSLRVFCFPHGNLTWRSQVERILGNRHRMERYVAEMPGPWLAKLYSDQVEVVWPPEARTIR